MATGEVDSKEYETKSYKGLRAFQVAYRSRWSCLEEVGQACGGVRWMDDWCQTGSPGFHCLCVTFHMMDECRTVSMADVIRDKDKGAAVLAVCDRDRDTTA